MFNQKPHSQVISNAPFLEQRPHFFLRPFAMRHALEQLSSFVYVSSSHFSVDVHIPNIFAFGIFTQDIVEHRTTPRCTAVLESDEMYGLVVETSGQG